VSFRILIKNLSHIQAYVPVFPVQTKKNLKNSKKYSTRDKSEFEKKIITAGALDFVSVKESVRDSNEKYNTT